MLPNTLHDCFTFNQWICWISGFSAISSAVHILIPLWFFFKTTYSKFNSPYITILCSLQYKSPWLLYVYKHSTSCMLKSSRQECILHPHHAGFWFAPIISVELVWPERLSHNPVWSPQKTKADKIDLSLMKISASAEICSGSVGGWTVFVYECQYVCVICVRFMQCCLPHGVQEGWARPGWVSKRVKKVPLSLWRDQLVCRSECHVQEEEEEQLTNPCLSGLGTSSQFTLLVLFISVCFYLSLCCSCWAEEWSLTLEIFAQGSGMTVLLYQ